MWSGGFSTSATRPCSAIPNNRTMVARGGLAAVHFIFRYHGKASHASSAPEKGISALDALLQLFFGINQLRQFAPPGYRIHGIITQGGVAPNIVPEHAEAEFIIRATNRRDLDGLKEPGVEDRGICGRCQRGLAWSSKKGLTMPSAMRTGRSPGLRRQPGPVGG